MSNESPSAGRLPGMGFLVFGMHRSGTSAVARLLGEAGANLGERIVPGSAGNEEGHWEDAFAVETNERLLADLGRSWDDPRPLPGGWLHADATRQAIARIADYLRSSRSGERAWAIKDPRMCLLADAWMAAVAQAGCPHAVILVARHPAEVAGSLAARDGLAPATAELAWLRHTLEAERATRGAPRVVLGYAEFLDDPLRLLDRLRALPGGDVLRRAGAQVVQSAKRHHRADDIPPGLLAEVWQQFQAAREPDAGTLDRCAGRLAEVDALYAPILTDAFRERADLWRRAARAEAALVELGAESGGPVSLHRAVTEMGQALGAGIERVVDGISGDIRRMQDEHAGAIESAARLGGQVGLLREELSRREQELQAARATIGDRERTLSEAREQQHADRATIDALERAASQARDGLQAAQATVGMLERTVAQAQAEQLVRAAQLEEHAARIAELEEQTASDAREHEARVEHLRRRLAKAEADLGLMLGSRSWRITRPMRVLARLLRGELSQQDRRRVLRGALRPLAQARLLPGSWRQRVMQDERDTIRPVPVSGEPPADPAAVAPAVRIPSKPDVFVWAVIDWHFRMQRPQHLARSLAEQGHRVFYLSNNLVDATGPGFDVERLDDAGRLFQVFLNAKGAPPIYFGSPCPATVAQLRRSMGELMQWADSDGGLCIVQHPFWTDVAAVVPGAALLYDCMDHHAGFADNAPDVLQAETRLIEQSDMVVVTSAWLEQELAGSTSHRALVRNGCDFEHFRVPPAKRYHDARGRRVIGYYGAIAEWFDVELVRALARAFPDCLVLLVGSDTAGVAAQLGNEPNVAFTGEVPYGRLPYYLHGFDVALLPFRVLPLTLATNPVKVYEYLCAGKPVVAVDLPELRQFGGLVQCASGQEEFLQQVGVALRETDPDLPLQRMRFAAEQTWAHRARELDEAIAALPQPRVSVIVLTYNNLEFTRACLHSLDAHSHWENLEVIVVDNASTDGTPDFLREWARAGSGRRIILNQDNVGFAAGNNIGLAAAGGAYL
ncbi:MAG TPA: glycosyltransferase, partial [Xanthomonadaceae bacterium]|nr:glycosyltransferase [Xanthomonadaceae bacterium]